MLTNKFQTAGLEAIRDFMNMEPYSAETTLEQMRIDTDRAKRLLDVVRQFADMRADWGFELEKIDQVLANWQSYHWKKVENACLLPAWEFITHFLTLTNEGPEASDNIFDSIRTMQDLMSDCRAIEDELDMSGIAVT